MRDITQYGASTSLSDNAPAINAAISAAWAAGGDIVMVPAGRWRTLSQIILKRGVTLQGVSTPGNFFSDSGFDLLSGSIIDVQWGSGSGASDDMTKAAVLIDGPQTAIYNLTFDYAFQSVDAATPTEYGPSIGATFNGHVNVDISRNWFNKSYVAIDMRGSRSSTPGGVGFVSMTANKGCPIYRGIRMDYLVDWCDVSCNAFNSGLTSNATPGVFNNLTKWSLAYGWAYEMGSGDWLQIKNCSAWGYVIGAMCVPDTSVYAGTGPYLVDSCNFDGCWYSVYLMSATHTCVGLDIHGCTMAPFMPVTGAHGAACIIDTGVQLDAFTFSNNRVFASPKNLVWGAGPGTSVRSSTMIGNVASGDHMDAAFVIGSGTDLIMVGNDVRNFSGICSYVTMPNVVNLGNLA